MPASRATMPDAQRKVAIGLIRVSQRGGRTDENLRSPGVQREAITRLCEERGWDLLDIYDEGFTSGGTSLEQRVGLVAAIELIEAKRAQLLVYSDKDRFDREPATRDEVIDRVEAAGGEVWTRDGRDTNETPALQFSGTVLSAAGRMIRRQAKEKSFAAVSEAIDDGVVPWADVVPGYRRGPDRRLVVHEAEAAIVVEAFKLRAGQSDRASRKATIHEVRRFLRDNGIERSYHGVQALLSSTIVLGRIDFGNRSNPAAHTPIVDEQLWKDVQDVKVPRGRRPKSDRLLARVGVLRCGTCGARLVVGTQRQNGRSYAFYRCVPTSDCTKRVAVGAEMVEGAVIAEVKRLIAGIKETVSAAVPVADAVVDLERAQGDLDAAILAFEGMEAEPAAIQRIRQLREARDAARDHHDRLVAQQSATSIAVSVDDWDDLHLDEQRALVVAVIDQVTVAPGRGLDRVTIAPRLQESVATAA